QLLDRDGLSGEGHGENVGRRREIHHRRCGVVQRGVSSGLLERGPSWFDSVGSWMEHHRVRLYMLSRVPQPCLRQTRHSVPTVLPNVEAAMDPSRERLWATEG